MNRTPRNLVLGLAAVAALSLSACSTGSTKADATTATSTKADAGAFPVTIDHAFGRTTITKEPKRVATIGWSDQDVALSLGVVPVGSVQITWGGNAKRSTPWFDAKLAELSGKQPTRYSDADGTPIEEIAKLAPDLILATSSGITKEEYAKLSKLAPVVAYPGEVWGTSWQDSLEMAGEALGREHAAEKVEEQTEKVIEDTARKYPQIKDRTFIFGSLSATDKSKIDYYTPVDNRPRLLTELGMKNAPFVEQASQGSKSFLGTISAEKAGELRSDVFVTYTEKPGQMKTFLADPLLGQIPAFKTGGWVDADNNTDSLGMSAPSPLSIPWAMEKFVPKVAEAVDRASK